MKPSLYDIDPGSSCPEVVRMIIEIPKGSTNKYEYDAQLGIFRLDRALFSLSGRLRVHPWNSVADGDPLHILALAEEPSFSGVEVRPTGILNMID